MPAAPKRLVSVLTLVLTFATLFLVALVVTRSRPTPPPVVSPLPGKPAPDFSLVDLDGKTVQLSALKGHVVVLDLWATWCPPCVAELPANVKMARKYADRGVQFYAVNVSDTPQSIRDFLDEHKIVTRVLLAGGTPMPVAYNTEYLPLLVVIDATGKVTAADTPMPDAVESTLSGWIENALKAGQAA